MADTDAYRIYLYGDHDNAFSQHPAYRNLKSWAWEELDDVNNDIAKWLADLRIDKEISAFGGHTVFGINGYIEFPDEEHRTAFLLKWH